MTVSLLNLNFSFRFFFLKHKDGFFIDNKDRLYNLKDLKRTHILSISASFCLHLYELCRRFKVLLEQLYFFSISCCIILMCRISRERDIFSLLIRKKTDFCSVYSSGSTADTCKLDTWRSYATRL